MNTLANLLKSGTAAFGTSGLRGLVSDLSPQIVEAATRASLLHMRARHGLAADSTVWLGRDLRPSSPAIADGVAQTANAMGHPVCDAGAVPTPALAVAAAHHDQPAIMVTGSHIPFDRNGIKFYRSGGEASKADEAAILNEPLVYETAGQASRTEVHAQVVNLYMDRYRAPFRDALQGLRIGFYQHSAVGRDLTVALFEALGAAVIPLGRSDTFIPIDTEAVRPTDRQQGLEWTEEHRLDVLFSTDGDGDRPLLADNRGIFFRGDALCMLAGYYLGVDHMVTPVSSNTALEGPGWFTHTSRTKIGSPHVIAAMESVASTGQSVAGFEANGGFLLGTDLMINGAKLAALPTRDAILPALACIMLAKERDTDLNGLHALLPARATASDRMENISIERSANLLKRCDDDLNAATPLLDKGLQIESMDRTDGARMTLSNGTIIHIRPSGNAPELRIYAEAETQEEADELAGQTKTRLLTML